MIELNRDEGIVRFTTEHKVYVEIYGYIDKSRSSLLVLKIY
jgi:hypothetical protein